MERSYEIPDNFLGGKREEYLDSNEACMLTAMLWAGRSKDPSTQVGACFVNKSGRIISTGYNGTPKGWCDKLFPWGSNISDGDENIKYPYVIHAEMNGVLNYDGSKNDFYDSIVFVTLFPCSNCAKLLIQLGVKKIVYLFDDRKETKDNICAKTLLNNCGVEYIDFKELCPNSLNNVNMSFDTGSKDNMIKIIRK